MAIVICGFPGVGKTTLFNLLKEQGIRVLDSDSSKFPKDGFPANYIEHIEQAIAEDNIVLVSTHAEVRAALAAKGINYILARPATVEQKEEYLQRYRDRGSPEPFLQLMEKNWEQFFNDVKNDASAEHFALPPNHYLFTIVAYLENR